MQDPLGLVFYIAAGVVEEDMIVLREQTVLQRYTLYVQRILYPPQWASQEEMGGIEEDIDWHGVGSARRHEHVRRSRKTKKSSDGSSAAVIENTRQRREAKSQREENSQSRGGHDRPARTNGFTEVYIIHTKDLIPSSVEIFHNQEIIGRFERRSD
jgi:hypothetical protein